MKVLHALVMVSLLAMLSACATFQTGTDVSLGRQAMIEGNNAAALGYFQSAAQADPTYIYGTELREGVWSYLGRAQYLNGRLPEARQTLERALSAHKSDFVARLYLGLTLVRQGDRQKGLVDIEAGMKGIYGFLDYMNNAFGTTFGQFWDSGRAIRSSIDKTRAMISSGKIDWPQLIADGESIAMKIEREGDYVRQQEIEQFQQQRQF